VLARNFCLPVHIKSYEDLADTLKVICTKNMNAHQGPKQSQKVLELWCALKSPGKVLEMQ